MDLTIRVTVSPGFCFSANSSSPIKAMHCYSGHISTKMYMLLKSFQMCYSQDPVFIYRSRGNIGAKEIETYDEEHGGALVESMPFNRRVVGSNLALAAT